MGGGHYVTYAKNPKKKWYCYNDSSCKVRTFTRVHAGRPGLDGRPVQVYSRPLLSNPIHKQAVVDRKGK